jgi:hypothetical protein
MRFAGGGVGVGYAKALGLADPIGAGVPAAVDVALVGRADERGFGEAHEARRHATKHALVAASAR